MSDSNMVIFGVKKSDQIDLIDLHFRFFFNAMLQGMTFLAKKHLNIIISLKLKSFLYTTI